MCQVGSVIVMVIVLRRHRAKVQAGLPTKVLHDYNDHLQMSAEDARKFLAQHDNCSPEEIVHSDDIYDAMAVVEWPVAPMAPATSGRRGSSALSAARTATHVRHQGDPPS